MDLKSQFDEFVGKIRLTKAQREVLKEGHTLLRERLAKDESLAPLIVSDFLQGSYRRGTAVAPKDGSRADVDVVVVTNIPTSTLPKDAMNLFVPFVRKYYKDKWEPQSRSIGIELSNVELDLVITSAPSEATARAYRSTSARVDRSLDEAPDWRFAEDWQDFGEEVAHAERSKKPEWKTEPLKIPDRDLNTWESTHPLLQLQWARDKNKRCAKLFLDIVKVMKWWRRCNSDPKYPKGYPVEHLVGEFCPDEIESIAAGVTAAFEGIVRALEPHAKAGTKPVFPDRGVPEHNVLGRLSDEDLKAFVDLLKPAADLARRALDADTVSRSTDLWKELLGPKFPEPKGGGSGKRSDDGGPGGFTPRERVTELGGGRFG